MAGIAPWLWATAKSATPHGGGLGDLDHERPRGADFALRLGRETMERMGPESTT